MSDPGQPVSRIESVLTHPRGFGLTRATNCQRAVCRCLDGVPLGPLWEDPRVRSMFGDAPPAPERPDQAVLCAGIRTAKTMIAAAFVWVRVRYADLSLVPDSESPPILPLVSVHKFNALATLEHIRAMVSAHDEWGEVIVNPKAESISILHHATGRPIEVMVVAGGRAATNLQSYWHISVVFDEVFSLLGADDAVANLNEAKRAVRGRILPGGQIFYPGSPIVSAGPGYELVKEHWSRPSKTCVVMRAPGRDMNPVHWTEEREAKLRDSVDQDDRDAYVTGALGEFLDALVGLLGEEHIRAITRPSLPVVPPQPDQVYGAAMDPATRRNAWTLVIAYRDKRGKLVVARSEQWQAKGTERLDPEKVLQEIAARCRPYRIDTVWTDQWSSDALRALARRFGLRVVEHEQSPEERNRSIKRTVDGVILRELELPPGDETLGRDLRGIKRRATRDGARYELTETVDGRHCDFVPPLAVLLQRLKPESAFEAPRIPGWVKTAYPDVTEAHEIQGILLPTRGSDPLSQLLEFGEIED